MRYYHKLGEEVIVHSESTSFLLARKAGGYFSLGLPNCTRYQGLTSILPFGGTWELFKSIENISIDDTPESIVLLPDATERIHRKALERFIVHEQAVTYELTHYNGPVRLTIDMRQIHDFEEWGRHYTIQDVPGGHVITYTCPRYSFCLAIIGAKATWNPQWREVTYPYDTSRKSLDTFHVFDCLQYQCTHQLNLRFGVGYTPAEALSAANKIDPQHHVLSHPDRDAALQAATHDLDGLLVTLPHLDLGILAGHPWFYQVYSRDEAISVGALIRLGNTEEAKRILLRSLQYLHSDGRIGNRFPASEISSADGVGWTFLRLSELYNAGALKPDDKVYVHSMLGQSLDALQMHHSRDGLITNGWKETWMDTTGGYEDGRPGARIEIQALSARMYDFMSRLCADLKDGDEDYFKQKALLLREAVRARFFDKETGVLADGIDDHIDRTIRPNIFLAAYTCPDLLSEKDWQRAMHKALAALWLPWGGLATIDKEHLLFTPRSTGETDKSYHRGDSWYFVNNLAAISLLQFGFISEAQQLYQASRAQLLGMGIPGHAAETSSASMQEAGGCFSQAWSAATFVELHFARQALSPLQSSSSMPTGFPPR